MVVAVILVRRFWRRRRNLAVREQAAACMFVTTLIMCSFVRSSVIANNDLGWRGMLIAQFILLLWATDLFRAWWRLQKRSIWGGAVRPHVTLTRWRRRMFVLLCLGGVSLTADFILIRTSTIFSDTGFFNRIGWMEPFEETHFKELIKERIPTEIGRRTFAMRQLYSVLDHSAQLIRRPSRSQIVQANSWLWTDIYHGLYAHSQEVSFSYTCAAEFGGDPGECLKTQVGLYSLFNDPTVAEGISIDDLCDQHHIDVLVVNDIDPVFRSRSSWVWRRHPIFANDMARAFTCGSVLAKNRPPTLQSEFSHLNASRIIFSLWP